MFGGGFVMVGLGLGFWGVFGVWMGLGERGEGVVGLAEIFMVSNWLCPGDCGDCDATWLIM